MKVSVERKITTWFIIVSVLGIFFTYETFKSRLDYLNISKWVRHSYKIQSEIQSLNNYTQQMEIQAHHYLFRGKDKSESLYKTALDSLNKGIQDFAELTKDNPRQQELLRILNRLNNRKIKGNQISFQSGNSPGAEVRSALESSSQSLVDSLRLVINNMDSEEGRLLEERIHLQKNASHRAIISLIIMVSLSLLVIGALYFLILKDIKKRKITELKLKESEAFLFKIFNEARDAFFLIDPKTNLIMDCNKSAVEMFDVKNKKELLNTSEIRFNKIPFSTDKLIEINSAMEKYGEWKGEIEYTTLSGRNFWGAVSTNIFEFNFKRHKLLRISDITERKNSEQVLKTYAEALEESKERLQTLTSELLLKNNELKKSETALKELNAGKDKFFSILAHDMRSPFTGLLGMSQYIAEYQDVIPQEEIREFSEAIYGSAKKVYGLLTNLLEWARFQMGKIEYLPSEVSLYETAVDILDLLSTNAGSKHIHIKNKINRQMIVFADQNMVSTILRNLVSNAIKFTNPGGEVRLSAEMKNLHVEIRVSDTGIGMSREVLDKIFRIDSKLTTKGTSGEEGTGLGLILCRELIEKNKGEIRVESHPDKGTEFIFTLPLFIKEELLEKSKKPECVS